LNLKRKRRRGENNIFYKILRNLLKNKKMGCNLVCYVCIEIREDKLSIEIKGE
jgi:hypothetical protein